ncbi:MAG: hypothetical protein IIA45_15225 [Bacteroidetes bacterium]|nr:hypothetical protein [Bacteroidota bacterium]
MKKLLSTLFMGALFVSFMSCGGGGSVEVSAEMQEFLDEISSSSSIVTAAGKYGYGYEEAGEEDIPLDLYELKEPSVKKKISILGQTCYQVNVKHGVFDSDFLVCWEDGKIVSIADME